MTKPEFIQVLALFLLIFITSTVFGLAIINVFKKIFKIKAEKIYPIEHIGAALLVGIGGFAYLSLILGVLGHFTKSALLLLVLACFLISIREIVPLTRSAFYHIKTLAHEYKSSIFALAVTVLSIITLGSLYLTAMQPPYTSDELHYHLPEVRQIVDAQKIDLNFGGHPFYGNIPKLMEIVFAVGKTLSNYQLSHALNFAIFLGFLTVIFSLVKKHYGLKAASLSILLLVWFDDLTWNATSGFVDAATTAFEISALLFMLNWTATKNKVSFYLSAILIGIAASIKYSPLPTAVFSLGIIIFKFIKENEKEFVKITRTVLPYIVTAFIFGGFWYVKNFIKLGNPFYPLYFGHRGYDEAQFKSLVDAIHEFGPKTPAYFFKLTEHYLTTTQFFVFLSIYISPIILFVKKQNKFRFSLFIYFLFYTIYWFFAATHQIRFLSTALVISIIILAVVASRIKYIYFAAMAAIILLGSLFYSNIIRHIDFRAVWDGFWNTKFHLIERQYALGNISESEFLRRQFGCQYLVIKYLESNNLEGAVIDNWSVWFAPSVSFYADKNIFRSFSIDTKEPSSRILASLKSGDIKYVYFDSKVKDNFLKSTDPLVIQSKDTKLPTEEYLLKRSKLIYQNSTCNLFQIEF